MKSAEIALNRLGDVALRCAAGIGLQAVPKEIMVPHLSGVVEHLGLCLVLVGGLDDLLERLALEGRPFDQLVQCVDVGLVVLAVMKLQGLCRGIGFQRIFREGQGW